ncbi:MAG: adenine-specific methyltransferase EcoRI family protein [Bacteroidales bacterium]|nr:adenine-specific methyltransferase EcoRI family protein [Bacteroidales bacterium]
MANENLARAQRAKNDEFYTQYQDIERELQAYINYDPDLFRDKTVLLPCDDPEWSEFTRYFAQRFGELGLRKLISTSYAPESKRLSTPYQPTLFEQDAPQYDPDKTCVRGKIFTLSEDITHDGKIDLADLQWSYMEGDGDFRSEEVCRLRDEADIIVTNPPFSLFREFVDWIFEAGKDFLIIGNMNAITYKNIFPRIAANEMWLGFSIRSGDREFEVPKEYPITAAGWRIDENGRKFVRVKGVRWYTNLEHGRRHEPLKLMTIEDNLRYSRNKKIKGKSFEEAYPRYDNYDAIEVGSTDAIPSDYDGVMGVPISFLDKYCPEQFEIIGATESEGKGFSRGLWDSTSGVTQPVVCRERERDSGSTSVSSSALRIAGHEKYDRPYVQGRRLYFRIFIRPCQSNTSVAGVNEA